MSAALSHTLVLAGAGSGKTRVLSERCAWLVQRRICHPNQILAISFTRKARDELSERISERFERGHEVRVDTFHAIASKQLRAHRAALGRTPQFSVWDENAQRKAMRAVLAEGGGDADGELKPAGVLGRISWHKNQGEGYAAAEEPLRSLWRAYEGKKRSSSALDFDDLLVEAAALMAHEGVRAGYRGSWRTVLVDEYQDTNPIQQTWLRRLCVGERAPALMAVGDDDQAIYSFRGADREGVERFEQHFPGASALALGENWRSHDVIVAAARGIVERESHRRRKTLVSKLGPGGSAIWHGFEDCGAEARAIAEFCERMNGEVGVLYRRGHDAYAVERALVERGIPYYKVGASKTLEHATVRAVLARLTLVFNPHDRIAFARAIGALKGVGERTLERIEARAAARGVAALEVCSDDDLARGEEARAALRSLHERIDRLARRAREGVPAAVLLDEEIERERSSAEEIKYREAREQALAVLDRLTTAGLAAAARVEGHGAPALAELCTSLVIAEHNPDETERSDAVCLATIHSAKGLEFPAVWTLGWEKGLLPSAKALEVTGGEAEERRIAYVAVTRAMRDLRVSSARERAVDQHGDARQGRRTLSPYVVDAGLHPGRAVSASRATGNDNNGGA